MDKIRPYAKALIALVGGAVAAITTALVALPEGATLGDINTLGWFVIVGAWLIVAGGVFGVANGTTNSG